MRKIFISILFFTILFSQITAQTVTVYDAFNATRTVDPKNTKSDQNNLQWNYSLLTRGAFVFTYERKINDYLGVEIGAGPTMYYDFSYYIFSTDFQNSLEGDSKNSYNIGMFLSAAAKIYPKQMVDFEGFYAAPTFRYRTYNYITTVSSWDDWGIDLIEYSHKRSLKATDMAFIVGYQWESWWEVTLNSYFGFGWTMRSYDKIDYDHPVNPAKKVNSSGPLFILGASLGITF